MGTAILDKGLRIWKWFDDYEYKSDDFTLVGEDFEKNYAVKASMAGNAECKLFEMKAGVDFAKTWLNIYRFDR